MADAEEMRSSESTVSTNVQLPMRSSNDLFDQTYAVSFGSILNVLTCAVDTDRAWLKDFCEDEIRVSADLYEIIQAAHFLES